MASTPIIDIACGCYHTLVLSQDHRVYSFGRNCHGQLGIGNKTNQFLPQQIDKLDGKRVTQIAAGFYHSVVVVSEKEENDLAEDMRSLINNPKHSDLSFMVEGKPIHVH